MENVLSTEVLTKPMQLAPRGVADVAMSRAVQEVQAKMIIAQRFPRDEDSALINILRECNRKGLAEVSQYTYPRGDQTVNGASIRLAEVLARHWGNIDTGFRIIEERPGETILEAYAHDIQTNRSHVIPFSVKHVRTKNVWINGKKEKQNQPLDDPRDIYELTANMASRRVRACILALIPGDIVDQALEQCDATLRGDTKEPILDRVRKMIIAFNDLGVTKEMIETRLHHKTEIITEAELVSLRKIYQTLRDNMGERSSYFDIPDPGTVKNGTDGLAEKLSAGKKNKTDKSATQSENETTTDQ